MCLQRTKIANPIANPGHHCSSGEFCDGGATCIQGRCICKPGFLPQGRNCVRMDGDEFGTKIWRHQSALLPEHSFKNAKLARAPPVKIASTSSEITIEKNELGAINEDTHRLTKKSPGKSCANDPSVCKGGSFCQGGFCICPEGYEVREDKCVVPTIYADPGESCDRPIGSISQVFEVFYKVK